MVTEVQGEGSSGPERARGGCLCGAVRFRVMGPIRDPVACHCGQCRRQTGHYAANTATHRSNLRMDREEGLRWYESSPGIRRGFCGQCGSTLFWDNQERPYMGIAAGSLDAPTGLRLAAHIFTADAGDYYELSDDLHKDAGRDHGVPPPPEE
ncbi:GFA family protein [Thiohalorhabdus sp. Cl-TMA]|uniref:GFA family protein n=1 Tax=Thiohalorhabdus methylotrophus TaxID=3242694 RepID=A0ABV4TV87_9GAMM